ncbi:MAG: 2Fe-2S iron-sulfur cluster-binding protein [Sphingomonadaceae bacterium]
MIKVSFIEPDGTRHEAEGDVDQPLVQVALDHLIPGILAECGGWCACATCHVYADDAKADALQPASDEEKALLEGALHVRPTSRLSCQIKLTEELDGLVLHLPDPQF